MHSERIHSSALMTARIEAKRKESLPHFLTWMILKHFLPYRAPRDRLLGNGEDRNPRRQWLLASLYPISERRDIRMCKRSKDVEETVMVLYHTIRPVGREIRHPVERNTVRKC